MQSIRAATQEYHRGFERLVWSCVTTVPTWMAWFGPTERPSPGPPGPPHQRDRALRPRVTEAVVYVALFNDPYVGKGGAALFELCLVGDGDRPGDPLLRLALRPADAVDEHPSGWSGPTTGRLLLDGQAFDFDHDHGSRLDQHHDALVLEARLGPAWIDRAETHAELLAALDGLLLMRELL